VEERARPAWLAPSIIVSVLGLVSTMGGNFVWSLVEAGRTAESITGSIEAIRKDVVTMQAQVSSIAATLPALDKRVSILELRSDLNDKRWDQLGDDLSRFLRSQRSDLEQP